MRGRSLVQSVALIAALFPITIVAQTTTVDPVTETSTGIRDRDRALAGARQIQSDLGRANFHNGPWYVLTRIQLSDIGFTEEFFVPTGDSGGGLALGVSAPTRVYYVPTKKVVFTGEFIPGYSYFNGEGEGGDGQFNYSARGGVQFLFNHLFVDLYALRADQLRPRIGDVNRLATLRQDEVGLSGELKYSSRTSMTFSTRANTSAYPSDRYQPDLPLDLLDRDEIHNRVQLIHKTLPRTSFSVAGEHATFDFTRATYKNGTRTYVAPGFSFDSGRITLRGEAGPAQIRFDDPTQKEFDGILGLLTGTYRHGRYALNAGVERDTDFSIMAFNNYYLQTRGAAALEYAATRRLKLRTSFSAERDEYDVPVHGGLRRDDITFTTVGFRYTLRRLTTGVDVGYYQRNSTFEGDQQDGIRYILHLSFSP